MKAQEMTEWHRANLAARTARARAEVEAMTAHARETGGTADGRPQPGDGTRRWNRIGHYAFIFCLWFVFLAPIALILANWD
jgi:hypothetical protein